MDLNLTNFIKYCLGYINLTRQRTFIAQQRNSVNLSAEYFNLSNFLNGDIDGNKAEPVRLETFYRLSPKEVTPEQKNLYEKEKLLANQIEEIYNKYRNDQFTKQIVINFGHFEIEIPVNAVDSQMDAEEIVDETTADSNAGDKITQEALFDVESDSTEASSIEAKIKRYPLFTLSVLIEKDPNKRYTVLPADAEFQVNIGMLQELLGEDLYLQLAMDIGELENKEKLALPVDETEFYLFSDIWNKVKSYLKHKNVNFGEDSFRLEDIQIALSPKSNYFLAEDLKKLSKLDEKELAGTSLSSWISDVELAEHNDFPSETEIYFPFNYDKYQLRVLGILNNKAAIVQGPPGTGKSETIANLLCHLASQGKKVLFVSQKAQALKVVKDKFIQKNNSEQKLKIQYLFGYIPNPRSPQISEEDEKHGAAVQLSALDSYLQKIEEKIAMIEKSKRTENKKGGNEEQVSPLKSIHNRKRKVESDFTSSVENERKFFALQEEEQSLAHYNLQISNILLFEKNFTDVKWEEIKTLKAETLKAADSLQAYEKKREKDRFHLKYSELDLRNGNYSTAVDKIGLDVEKTGYDRHSHIVRILSNSFRAWRLRDVLSKLPREIVDDIYMTLNTDISRNEAKRFLDELKDYCSYRENIHVLENIKTSVAGILTVCGLSESDFRGLSNILVGAEPAEIMDSKIKIVRLHSIKKELEQLSSENTNGLTLKLTKLESERQQRILTYLQNIINASALSKQNPAIRRNIEKLSRAFGKSKRAFKTFDRLRKDPEIFKTALDFMPVWIMELDDASRIIPLETGLFDCVIFDEASQCNVAYTLPSMFRAKRALFFGDSEQMRDNTILFKSNKSFDELASRYQIPDDLQIKATGTAVQSVLNMAAARGFKSITLRNHYRSPRELIGFSNKYFYKPQQKDLIVINSNYVTYKDTARIIVIHHVEVGGSYEFSDKVNVSEAKAIFEFFKQLRADDKYKDKSIGVLSFFNAQATYIRKLFEDEGFKEERDNYKVGIIEGIQGDEKDIVIYSFVIWHPDQKKRYLPLTGEGGDVKADINKGRVNVAFSRARLQAHCFVSMAISQVPNGIWIKKYLEHVEQNGEVSFHSTDLKPFGSNFERGFYELVRGGLSREYIIQNQVESCGFKIDFVISNSSNGKKIAVECDGPTHFKDEIDEAYGIYVENDLEREKILRAAGWEFYRIKYSDWRNEAIQKDVFVKDVVEHIQ